MGDGAVELSAREYAIFCEVSRDSVRGSIGAEKIIFPACKYFARMGSVIYVSERNKNSAPEGEITMLNELRLPHFPWGIVEWPIGGKR